MKNLSSYEQRAAIIEAVSVPINAKLQERNIHLSGLSLCEIATAAFDAQHGLALLFTADRRATIEKIARLLAARQCGISNRGENLPDELWQQKINTAASVFDLLAANDLTQPTGEKINASHP